MVRYTAEWRAIVLLAARPEIHHSRREKCHQAGCCAVNRWSPTPRVPRWRYQGAPIHRQPASRLRRAAKTPMNCATTWRASHGSIAPLVDVTTDGAAAVVLGSGSQTDPWGSGAAAAGIDGGNGVRICARPRRLEIRVALCQRPAHHAHGRHADKSLCRRGRAFDEHHHLQPAHPLEHRRGDEEARREPLLSLSQSDRGEIGL